ncbi:MAG: hypothetical protein ACRCWS_04480 [Propionibacteriaceae bacterium]
MRTTDLHNHVRQFASWALLGAGALLLVATVLYHANASLTYGIDLPMADYLGTGRFVTLPPRHLDASSLVQGMMMPFTVHLLRAYLLAVGALVAGLALRRNRGFGYVILGALIMATAGVWPWLLLWEQHVAAVSAGITECPRQLSTFAGECYRGGRFFADYFSLRELLRVGCFVMGLVITLRALSRSLRRPTASVDS